MRLVIVAADFNKDIVGAMIEAARQEIQVAGASLGSVLTVPGCYEIPLLAERQIRRENVDGLVILGYIERGKAEGLIQRGQRKDRVQASEESISGRQLARGHRADVSAEVRQASSRVAVESRVGVLVERAQGEETAALLDQRSGAAEQVRLTAALVKV